jgi:glycosyltransferase involved in cell wall biosynthesis
MLMGLANMYPEDQFLHCYRFKNFLRVAGKARNNVRHRLLMPPLPTFRADLFHALNQRVDRRPAKKVVTTFHDLFVMTAEYSSRQFRQRFSQQAQLAAENSDLIIAVSRFTAEQVSSLLGFDPARIRVVPHGVFPPSENGVRRRDKVILFVGALQARKNVSRLVEAFESVPEDWRLILAGSSGYEAVSIRERVKSSECRDRIQVMGYVRAGEIDNLYSRASIFAFPSLDEGFGIPVLEAMVHGVPVVASNRPSLVEVAGDAAILVDPRSTADLATALRRLATDPELRDLYAQRGRERAKLYPWQRTVRETYAVYKELLG